VQSAVATLTRFFQNRGYHSERPVTKLVWLGNQPKIEPVKECFGTVLGLSRGPALALSPSRKYSGETRSELDRVVLQPKVQNGICYTRGDKML